MSKILKKPVFLTDAGFYIEALKGFPGPFVKYINNWFDVDEYLRLMKGVKNRKVVVRDCLAYCEPGKKAKIFISETHGEIALKLGRKGISPIDSLFIPDGLEITTSDMKKDEMLKFWEKSIDNWKDFSLYLKNKFN